MKVGLCRHFPNIKQVIIPIFFHIVNGFSTGFAGGFLYYNEKTARGSTPTGGFLLLYTAFQPHDRLNGIPFVPQKLRNFPAILEHRKIQTNPL